MVTNQVRRQRQQIIINMRQEVATRVQLEKQMIMAILNKKQ